MIIVIIIIIIINDDKEARNIVEKNIFARATSNNSKAIHDRQREQQHGYEW